MSLETVGIGLVVWLIASFPIALFIGRFIRFGLGVSDER